MKRIVHMGLGNFHRAHQAWWTRAVSDEWEICAYSHRRLDLVEALTAQGGRYTLVERGPDGDRHQLLTALTETVAGTDTVHLRRRMADPATLIVTLTVTEAGYHLRPDGRLDVAAGAVRGDRATLRAGGDDVQTPVGRLVLGLDARRRADAGPIAIVPCDNLPANGHRLAAAVCELVDDPALADWVRANVSFVDTSVDRITPRVTEADRAGVEAATGFADRAPVVTEPFRDWVLSGAFPGGRPPWEREGARFVEDIAPWERRKLYLLNGAHSLLAYTGLRRGHTTVAEAIADPDCAGAVESWWREVVAVVDVPELDEYLELLRRRFANPAIRHNLDQIAEDGHHKLRVRVAEPAIDLRAIGVDTPAAASIIAAWMLWSGRPSAHDAVALLSPILANDREFLASVHNAQKELL